MINVVSLSGGKDSVALWLWARRTGLDPVAAYVDTGWEWDGHHQHLDLLEARIGKIHRIGPRESFEDVCRRKKSFPGRVRKWCTEELKLKPFAEWLDKLRAETGDECQVLLGIRHEESASRALAVEREHSDLYDCDVWRPILDWTVEQVIAEHRAAAIPMHPLYHHGAERVGCFPCINAGKAELEVVARIDPARIDRIRALEAELGVTMFARDRRTEKLKLLADGATKEEAGPSVAPLPIDEAVAWSRTERGGKQIALVKAPSGCARWGVCERAPQADEPAGGGR